MNNEFASVRLWLDAVIERFLEIKAIEKYSNDSDISIKLYDSKIQVQYGIEKMAKSVGCNLEMRICGKNNNLYQLRSFVYKEVEFFQLDKQRKERENG